MVHRVTLIGFGEAGSTFSCAGGWGSDARAYDVVQARRSAMADLGVVACDSAGKALHEAPLVLSLVTADQALQVAQGAAANLKPGALFCDMNSVAPETKREAARIIGAAGGRYVDAAIMAPVSPQKLSVPLSLSGADASSAQVALEAIGFDNIRIVGDEVGRASTIKMLRSVMYKGMEALTAECLLACERAGVTDEVLGSFGSDWASGADYRVDRMLVHGARRAAELREVCKTLEDLGLPPRMSSGTVAWQQAIGDLGLSPAPDGLESKLDAIAATPAFAKRDNA